MARLIHTAGWKQKCNLKSPECSIMNEGIHIKTLPNNKLEEKVSTLKVIIWHVVKCI